MADPEAFTNVDLKKFFEASLGALQNGNESGKTNQALVRRERSEPTLRSRAVTDAARALSALWQMPTPKKAI